MVDLTRDFETTSETIRSIIEKVDFSCQKLVFLLNNTDICEVNRNSDTTNYIVSLLDDKGISCSFFESDKNYDSDVLIIPISAKTGTGIQNLRSALATSQRDLLGDSDTTLVTNQRHIQALSDARTSLWRVSEGLNAGLPTDLAAQDIREAIYHLGSIVGEISSDEVLGNIFRNFCIGK
jgi:tRNA modification GTPase